MIYIHICKKCPKAMYYEWYESQRCQILMHRYEQYLQAIKPTGHEVSEVYKMYDSTDMPPKECPYLLEQIMRNEQDKEFDENNPKNNTGKIKK